MDDDRDQHRPERDRERHAGINPTGGEHAGHRLSSAASASLASRRTSPWRRGGGSGARRPLPIGRSASPRGGEAPERARTASGARRRDFRSVRRAGIGRAQRCVVSTILPLASRRRSRCIASAARSSGNVSEITGAERPFLEPGEEPLERVGDDRGLVHPVRAPEEPRPRSRSSPAPDRPEPGGCPPVAKPMTSSRPSHAMQRIDWAKTSPPTGIEDDVGPAPAGDRFDGVPEPAGCDSRSRDRRRGRWRARACPRAGGGDDRLAPIALPTSTAARADPRRPRRARAGSPPSRSFARCARATCAVP